MTSKHTPGPWFTKREGFSTVYVEARLRGSTIQEVAACGPTEAGSEQQEANARLIAAAPELLEALIRADQMFREIGFIAEADRLRPGSLGSEIRAAIAKATGASSAPRVAPREEHPPCPGCLDTGCNGECMENL